MAPLELLPTDCLRHLFGRLISQFDAFLGLSLTSQALLSVARDRYVANAVLDYITDRNDFSYSIKCISFYSNIAPFDSFIQRFPRHELTKWLENQEASIHAPFKAKMRVAIDLLRQYPRLEANEQDKVKELLQIHQVLPGPGFERSFAEIIWSPIRYTKILLLDGQMRRPVIEALGYGFIQEIYGLWLFITWSPIMLYVAVFCGKYMSPIALLFYLIALQPFMRKAGFDDFVDFCSPFIWSLILAAAGYVLTTNLGVLLR